MREFRANLPVLNDSQMAVATALSAVGIAFTSLAALDIPTQLWDSIGALCDQFAGDAGAFLQMLGCHRPIVAGQLTAFAGTVGHNAERSIRFLTQLDKAVTDDYLVKLNPPCPTLDLDNPLLRFGLDPAVLDVVNSYFGLWSKLIYTDVWYQIQGDQPQRIGSQRWHRDPDDRQIVKVYLYLSDVDDRSGAMQYVSASCNRLTTDLKDIAPWRAAGGSHYPPPEVVDSRIPQSRIMTAVGKKGTLVFCDTTGLHRGNIAIKSSRIAATWTFVSPASLFPRRFTLASRAIKTGLSPAAQFAVMC